MTGKPERYSAGFRPKIAHEALRAALPGLQRGYFPA